MISSRAMTPVFKGETLSEVRQRLQRALHDIRWFDASTHQLCGRDQRLFEVWIHENHAGDRGDRSTLDLSIAEIHRADVIVVLYTGEAGSAEGDAAIGICHAEMHEAISRRPEIVALVDIKPLTAPTLPRDQNFQRYVQDLQLFSPQAIDHYDQLQHRVIELLQERVAQLVELGARAGGRRLDRGQKLDWNRLDPDARQRAMRAALAQSLGLAPDEPLEPNTVQRATLNGDALAVRLHAIPAALGNAAARERVGQPFLRDHDLAAQLDALNLPGIVHLIACHRGITEAQALRMLGSPDAMAVASDFGVYALDRVQRVQLLLLAQCSDQASTDLAVRRLGEWLRSSGEQARVLANATSRRRILQAIAAEDHPAAGD